MEKGSILPSHAKPLDEMVKGIPLPTQLPKGVDFSEIPMAALKSSTLESLLSQNEDLMARLAVALRKVHELEENAVAQEQDKKSLQTRLATLKEQYLILSEKDKSATERSLKQYQENVTLKTQGEKIETLYAELYAQARALQARVVRLERYRRRIKRIMPRYQKDSKRIALLEREVSEHKSRLIDQAVALREENVAKVSALENKLETVKREMSAEHMRTINAYEVKLAEALSEIQALKPRALDRDQIYEKHLQLENQRIFDQRQFEQSRADNDLLITRLKQETASLRQELKDALVDREAQLTEVTRLTAEVPHLQERNQNLLEQVESLQALWNQKQREIEQMEEKNKSLQKLNQSLSITLNQQRKEIHQLKVELDTARLTHDDQVKNLQTEIQLIRDGASKL